MVLDVNRIKTYKPGWIFYSILVTCIVLTSLVFKFVRDNYIFKQKIQFNAYVNKIEDSIKDRMNSYIDAHYSGVGLFLSSKSVEREEWKHFVKALNITERHKGINGLGFAVWLEHERKNEFLNSVRADSAPDYKIKPEGIRKDYFPIVYIEPIEKNLPALGYDMGSEARRRKAMEEARDTGIPRISRKIILVQDKQKTPGFLSYVPFYDNGVSPKSLEERRKKFKGWIYAPFIMRNFINGVFEEDLKDIKDTFSLEIYDAPELTEESLLYATKLPSHHPESKILSIIVPSEIYGVTWYLKISANDNFLKNISGANLQYIVLLVGFLFTFLILYLFISISNSKNYAINLAEKMTKELNEKNKELEKSNEDLQTFSRIASHDLKEPLRTIASYVDVLGVRLKSQGVLDDEKLNGYFENIKSSCHRMRFLINDLLEFSGLVDVKDSFEEVDCNEVLNSVLSLLDKQIKEKDAEIRVFNKLPMLKAYETRLTSVFQNLISNSIKYCERKPIIEISSAELEDGSGYKFIFKDNGIGIEEKYHGYVFELFKRLHSESEYSGTGLGLSITKKIVEAHNGEISMDSKPGEGTMFVFTIRTGKIAVLNKV